MRVYVREWRMHKGLTQTELAKRIGVTKGEISRLEGGTRRITTEWMGKIGVALGIDPTALPNPPTGPSGAYSATEKPSGPAPTPEDENRHLREKVEELQARLRAVVAAAVG